MDGTNLASISLRPGGGTAANPFTAFTQGAGVKSAPQKVRSIASQSSRSEADACTAGGAPSPVQ